MFSQYINININIKIEILLNVIKINNWINKQM
jgi:hypothetical protein